jgi:hypothetical protein
VRSTSETKVPEITTVPTKRRATVASHGTADRSPVAPRRERRLVRNRLCDSQTPPVSAPRPADVVQPGRTCPMFFFGLESHHRLNANIAAMAAKYQTTASGW